MIKYSFEQELFDKFFNVLLNFSNYEHMLLGEKVSIKPCHMYVTLTMQLFSVISML